VEARTGRLRIRVDPVDAEIRVDGRVAGHGVVIDLELPAGPRRLHAAAPGYVSFDTTFVVNAGETAQLPRVTLRPVEGAP
jgi:hypothetical protein